MPYISVVEFKIARPCDDDESGDYLTNELEKASGPSTM
jgi:hypothetical protein